MNHKLSEIDQALKVSVETGSLPASDFDHSSHLRLAYIYLVESASTDQAIGAMRRSLLGLLKTAGIDPAAKYHETLTEAWIRAVSHFMNSDQSFTSSDEFVSKNPAMLNSEIMLSHYSANLLFSERARQIFVEPDLLPIPEHRVEPRGHKQ